MYIYDLESSLTLVSEFKGKGKEGGGKEHFFSKPLIHLRLLEKINTPVLTVRLRSVYLKLGFSQHGRNVPTI